MMTLQAFCDLISAELVIRRYPNQQNRWTACFGGCEIKEGATLTSTTGEGTCAEDAINDYLKKIKKRTLVFDAMSDRRREYVMPENVLF